MKASFSQIDGVFGGDVPMCGINLKKMWCEYTCNPRQDLFLSPYGYKNVTDNDGNVKNMTKVYFAVDDTMACDQFRSCKKVSLVA